MAVPLSVTTVQFESVSVDRRGTVVSRTRGQAEQAAVELAHGLTIDLVLVPGGSFLMGSAAGQGYPDERPQRSVTVAPFFLGKHPVTQAQWEAIAGPSHCRFHAARLPVENVSWDDAGEFCRRLSERTGHLYRLPSEAEWERACRAGTTTPFSCGETITTDLANYNGGFTFAAEPEGIYRHRTTEVGSFAPNAFGLCDLHGNVWEWCADRWHEGYDGAPGDGGVWGTEPGEKSRLRFGVLRGGSWHDTPDVCRSAVRLRGRRGEGDELTGFRLALSPP